MTNKPKNWQHYRYDQATVNKARTWRAQRGLSYCEIANRLNEQGIPVSRHTVRLWCISRTRT